MYLDVQKAVVSMHRQRSGGRTEYHDSPVALHMAQVHQPHHQAPGSHANNWWYIPHGKIHENNTWMRMTCDLTPWGAMLVSHR